MIRLTDEQWERIRDHFPEENIADGRHGRKPTPARCVLEAVLWILNTGAQWHMLPQSYPTPPDLTQDALERVVGANPPPMLLWEGVVGERLLDRHFHQLGGAAQAQATQLLDHSDGLLARCGDVLAGVDRLEHGRDLPHLGRGHVAEDVAVPVHDAPLPGGLWARRPLERTLRRSRQAR